MDIVLFRGKRARTVPDDLKTCGSGFYNKNRRACESSLQTCKYVLSLSPTRGSSVHDKRNSREAKYDREFALGRAEGIRVCSQQGALVCAVAQNDLKKTVWSSSVEMLLTLQITREQCGAKS